MKHRRPATLLAVALSVGLSVGLFAPAIAADASADSPDDHPFASPSSAMQTWMRATHDRAQRFVQIRPDWPVGVHDVTAQLTFDAQGTMTHLALYVSSGYPDVDDSVMTALRRMHRLPRLPGPIGADGGSLLMPFVFHVGRRGDITHWAQTKPRFADPDRQVSFELPASMALQTPRMRPGYAWIVGIETRAGMPPTLDGQSRLCDVGLQPQQPQWQGQDQRTLNAGPHLQAIDAALRAGTAQADMIGEPATLRFGGNVQGSNVQGSDAKAGVVGREVVVTPHAKPAERHYLAVADTPQFRLTITCATSEAHIDAATPLFRAVAAKVTFDAP